MHEFIYDGLPSSVFGAYIASSNFLDGASRDVSPVMIPGRNGNLNLDNKRFNNFTLVENLYIRKDITQNADALRQFLAAHSTTYYPIEEDFTPEIFRMARYSGAFTVETFDHVGGAFSIEFDCKPQRFLKSGTVMQEITSGSALNNPTAFASQPLIRIYGNGTLTIGTQTVTVTGNSNAYVDVDSEIMDCFYGTTNLNSKVALSGHEFPVLEPGANAITYTDITKVEITPRWYMI